MWVFKVKKKILFFSELFKKVSEHFTVNLLIMYSSIAFIYCLDHIIKLFFFLAYSKEVVVFAFKVG